MKNTWIFIEKKGDASNRIERVEAYGSITAIAEHETVVINGRVKTEHSLRNLLKDDMFANEKYLIVKRDVIRSTRKN